MQSNGAREAIETIRKKLKHGGTQQKLRALEVRERDLIMMKSITYIILGFETFNGK